MEFTARRDPRTAPPVARASRWVDGATADAVTTQVLRRREAGLRRAAALREPWFELRGPAAADVGTLLVHRGGEPGRVEHARVSSAVVRMDLSRAAPVVLAAFPEALDALDGQEELLQVLARLGDALPEHWWDPDHAVDGALAADPDRAGVALAQWRGALGGVTATDLLERVLGAPAQVPEPLPPEAWAARLDARFASRVGGGTRPVVVEDVRPARTGDVADGVDLGRTVAEALERSETEVADWLLGRRGTRRLHLVVDLGRDLGTVTTRRPRTTALARHLAVVLQRDSTAPDGFTVLDAGPDRAVDEELRRTCPVTAALVGGYFGVGLERLEVLPWPAQRTLLTSEPDDVLAVFRQEVADAAETTGTGPGGLLDRLGGAVAPRDPRAWLRRLAARTADLRAGA